MVMPSACRFAAVVMMNDVKQGLLHSYIRHFDQWELVVPQLSIIKTQLPDYINNLMSTIAASALHSMKRASAEKQLADELKKPAPGMFFNVFFFGKYLYDCFSETKRALCTAQNLMLDFLGQHVAAHSASEICLNKRGKLQARVTVTCGCGLKTLVVGTDDINPKTNAKKAEVVRSITTMYFTNPPRTPPRK
uniref:DRBM domain-containing protein n=1 Tax=Panagrellus redivivus TaxID=6233 RepID=A0A7E4VD19_PANRE